jgi:hypothetical protein
MNPAQPVTKHLKQGSVSQEFSANAHSNIVADYTGKSLNAASSSTGLASGIHFSPETERDSAELPRIVPARLLRATDSASLPQKDSLREPAKYTQ